MADDELRNENIVLASVEDTGPQIKVKDQYNRTYSFFKNKKDGSSTAAFRDFQQFKVGDTAEISYKDVPYKDGIIRNITNFRPATGPVETTPRPTGEFRSREGRPGREYWERRDSVRQHSILLQVAFKAAVELQSAKIRGGGNFNREEMYSQTMDFYRWIASHMEEGGPQEEVGGPGEEV